jgi:lipopolysaccharide transport system permease protein
MKPHIYTSITSSCFADPNYGRNLMVMRDIWLVKHWDLIKILTINDLKVKYQHTYLGLIWSLLSPLLLLVVTYYIFYNIRHLETNFAQYLLVGILTWRFFTTATSTSLLVIRQKSSLLSNIVLPNEIFVLIKNLSALISSTLEFIVLVPLVALLTGEISFYAILFPIIHILYFLVNFGLSLILSSCYPYFRDLGEIWPFVIQLGFFVCPILYPITIIPESIRDIYMLNPITQFMIIYRDFILYGIMPSLISIGYVFIFGVCLVIIGHYVFKKLEKRFAEVV